MNNLPSIEFDEFEKVLNESRVALKCQPYYKHWLGTYLQFCTKYQLPEKNKDSLDPFLKALRTHNLKEFQVTQANHAVFLFYLMHDSKSINTINWFAHKINLITFRFNFFIIKQVLIKKGS